MSRPSRILLLAAPAAAVTALVLLLVGLSARGEAEGAAAAGSGPAVVIPIGAVPRHQVAAVTRRLGEMGFRPVVAPARPLPRGAVDPARGQRVADDLLQQARAAVPAGDGDAPLVIGLTTEDMYWIDRPEWRFVFALRQEGVGGVLSSARMDPRFHGLPPDPAAIDRRLDASLVRVVGLAWLGVPYVADETCANRESVLALDELDMIRPVLCDA